MSAATILLAVAAIAGEPQAPSAPGETSAPEGVSAEALFRRGVDAYDEGKYGEALRSFQDAYQRAPEPGILFNVAQAYRALRDCRRALDALDAVITANGADPSLVNRARAKRDEFERCAGSQTPPVPALPVVADVHDSPVSTHRKGETSEILVIAAPQPRSPRASWVSSWWGKGCLLSAGAAFGFGAAGAGLTWAAHDRADFVNGASTWSPDVQAADRDRRGLATAAIATFAASGATAILSGAMCWLGWRGRD